MQEFWTIGTFDHKKVPDFVKTTYEKILPYVTEFLCALHPYRSGKICSFVPSAIKNDRIFFTYTQYISIDDSKAFLKSCIEYYQKNKSTNRLFGALIVLFPEDYDLNNLLKIHLNNKEQCVSNSLMLGALYPTSNANSLCIAKIFTP